MDRELHSAHMLPADGDRRFVTVLPTSILRFNGKNLAMKVLPIRLPIQPGRSAS